MECCRVSVSQKKIHDRLVESGCVLSVSVGKIQCRCGLLRGRCGLWWCWWGNVGRVCVVSASTDSVSRTSVLKQGEQLVKVKYRLK